MLLLIYIILSFLILINGTQIYIKKPSIMVLEYFNNFESPISIQLNGYKFRESSIMPKNKGIFPLKLNPGYYNIDNNITFKYKLYNGIKLGLSKYHLKDKLIKKNKWSILDEIEYYNKNEHNLNIRYLINVIERNNNKINYNLKLKIDEKEFNYKNIIKNGYFIIKDNIKLKEGKHKVIILSKSNIDYLCSCPSIYDGFFNGRHLFIWSNNIQKEENITLNIVKSEKINNYVLSIIVEKELNINNIYDSYKTNKIYKYTHNKLIIN